jgi:serine phosphatase RsbU (regulator of sigma subunit)
MDPDDQILKEKALLLISRERELLTLRNKHQRLLNWLSLFQSLPQVVDRRLGLAEIGAKFVSRIISSIKLQRVHLLEFSTDGARSLGTDQSPKPPLPDQTLAYLAKTRSGMLNEPEDACIRALAESLNLHRLLWYRLDLWEDKMVLLVGGFDQQRAASYMPFDQEDAEHFAHAGQHFESLLSNYLLLNELERDKQHLERFNEELELRVRERTEELARANQEITQALSDLREKDRRLSEDLEQARAFQQSILPVLPQASRIEFGALYKPLDRVGGDIYDVANMGGGHYRVFMADATGHGVQASLRTMVIKSEYDRIKHAHESPETLLGELNRRLVGTYSEHEMLCTGCCFDVKLNAEGAILRYSNAAHPPLFHWSQSGVLEVYQPSLFLGLSLDTEFQVEERPLELGDAVVAYTDGISDQPDLDSNRFDLQQSIQKNLQMGQPLTPALDAICGQFERFCGSAPVVDDITLVATRIGPCQSNSNVRQP